MAMSIILTFKVHHTNVSNTADSFTASVTTTNSSTFHPHTVHFLLCIVNANKFEVVPCFWK